LWLPEDDLWLRKAWGRYDLAGIAKALKRSMSSITERARKLKLRRRTMTLRAFARYAGVSTEKVKWAIKQSGLEIRRVSRADPRQILHEGKHLAITPKQQVVLLAIIRAHPGGRLLSSAPGSGKTPCGTWGVGRKPNECHECDRSDRPHYAKGYCKGCYIKVYKWVKHRANNPARPPRPGSEPSSLMLRR